MFAKLFETEQHGQILVTKITSNEDDRAAVKFTFQPKSEKLGLAEMSILFDDDEDESQAKLDAAFARVDDAIAIGVADSWERQFGRFGALVQDAEG